MMPLHPRPVMSRARASLGLCLVLLLLVGVAGEVGMREDSLRRSTEDGLWCRSGPRAGSGRRAVGRAAERAVVNRRDNVAGLEGIFSQLWSSTGLLWPGRPTKEERAK
ncbi:hypothetical protein B0T19DRAFT_39659 [Cercophora scortea]|uniref:Uncharacterized protein n=1 Tax=Cercophora scortea TaxID=314031 RepID=A0AAE0J3X1_9PEZI|nr:hypothetical protein B0T19DRAFT_39659 [Cercophora scortea]